MLGTPSAKGSCAAKQPLYGNFNGQLANRTACGCKDRVRDSRRDWWHARLTYTAGRFAAAHNVHIDLRHFADAQHVVGIEIPLLSASPVDGDGALQCRRE